MKKQILAILLGSLSLFSCQADKKVSPVVANSAAEILETRSTIPKVSDIYADFTLTTDLSHLDNNQKKMIPLLIEIAKVMDDLFWLQSYGNKDELLNSIGNENLKRLVDINYGPWDRLNGDKPLIPAFKAKPLGANFYPKGMSKQEFESSNIPNKKSLYTVLRRNNKGVIRAHWYHDVYATHIKKATSLLLEAAKLAKDKGFKKYLNLRASALASDNYKASDMAWMDMKNNDIDFIVGPIETYEDQLFGYKAAYEAYVLIKDKSWSKKLAKFAALLPQLQRELPIEAKYKTEKPGTDSDLNAYDVLYYAGHSNAGSKTIAINLPNDETVQLAKGSRRLQLKNAMKAKFEKILMPIANVLVEPSQRKYITFNAFFGNTMFHEVAHGLGIKETINGKGTVRQSLKQFASAQEEGKADILGLYMVEKLYKMGELSEGQIMDNYVTFMAGIFRSVRFGSSSAHGIANMLRFNYFAEHGAFSFNKKTGYYSVNPKKMSKAVET
ncbi:MAG TPA: Zn-dependent hydrolase, partial [Oceanospirillales bacterium]|nr:Zn-dependent hydrolase [Oceanospirillales bacterium]